MGLHHTPEWYRDHCKTENVNPSLRKLLREDCIYIGADPDKNLLHIERLENYDNQWKEIFKKPHEIGNGFLISLLGEVIEREHEKEIEQYERKIHREMLKMSKMGN